MYYFVKHRLKMVLIFLLKPILKFYHFYLGDICEVVGYRKMFNCPSGRQHKIKEYILKNPTAMDSLMDEFDSESRNVLLSLYEKLKMMPSQQYLEHCRFDFKSLDSIDRLIPDFNLKLEKMNLKRKSLPFKLSLEEYYFLHGMVYIENSKVIAYLKNGTFLDCGAYSGGSAYVMQKYLPYKVVSFEMDVFNANLYLKNIKKLNLEKKCQLIQKGLGQKSETLYCSLEGSGAMVVNSGNNCIELISIDDAATLYHLNAIKWIKADIEGYGLKMLKGAVETIRRDRPIITLAVYHNVEELFEAPSFINSLNLNYVIYMRYCSFYSSDFFNEVTLIALPKELV